ncbi:hypothetical protein CNR29_07335 [Levilactobacillus brevis]|uniref:DUF3383 family protein n=1 Tax=Levilactobacillus brevis TaxID=1580 RepID=A0A2A3TYQ8_LEVBR|nr:hypothetical protein [Levilactobacillus brevis]PBQ23838.1 hypothetical protein CNR29_07335 [Levilactobacillus brevis]
MTSTLFSTVNRISPAHISNQYTTAAKTVFAGGLVKGQKQGIKVYDDLDAVAEDFDMYSPFWKKARAYFTANGEAASLLALTYAPVTAAVDDPTNVQSQATSDGAKVTASSGSSSTTTPTMSADATGAVTALKKYYFAGPQMWFLVDFDDEVAQAISNFIELQNTGMFILYANDPTKLRKYPDNKRTMKFTLPEVDDSSADVQDTYNNVLDAAFVGAEYGRKPHSAVKYALGDLPYTKPQDRFDFTPDDLADLDKYNIVTYAYVLESPRVTSSRMSADGVHIDTILGWDWIQNEANSRVANLFIQNAAQGIPYSEVGFNAVVNVIRGTFLDAGDLDIIAPAVDADGNETGKPDYSVDYLTPSRLPKSYETKREMRGIKTKYHPMGMVEDVYIENTIVM